MIDPPPAEAPGAEARSPAWTAGAALALSLAVLRTGAGPLLLALLVAEVPLLALVAARGGEDPLYLFMSALAGLLQAGLVTAGAWTVLRGQRPTVGGMFASVGGRLGTLFLQQLLANLLVGLGLVALVIPGLVAFAGLLVAAPVVMVERETTAVEALRRSWELTRGRRLPALQVGLLLTVGLLAAGGLGYLLSRLPLPFHGGQLLAELVALPFLAALHTGPAVLYRLLRAEREGAEPGRPGAVHG
jgi:hypothetical protein